MTATMDLLDCQTGSQCAECWHFRENVGCVLLFKLNDALRAAADMKPRELPLHSIVFRDAVAEA